MRPISSEKVFANGGYFRVYEHPEYSFTMQVKRKSKNHNERIEFFVDGEECYDLAEVARALNMLDDPRHKELTTAQVAKYNNMGVKV